MEIEAASGIFESWRKSELNGFPAAGVNYGSRMIRCKFKALVRIHGLAPRQFLFFANRRACYLNDST